MKKLGYAILCTLFFSPSVFGQFIIKNSAQVPYMSVNSSGQIAIGDITPQATLDVQGSVRLRNL